MLNTILNGLLPVAFVIVLGWLSARIGLLKHDDADVLATLVIRFALPFALFEGAVKTPPDKLHNVGFALCLTLGLMGTYFIALGVGRFVFRHDLRTATIQALVCAFPDMAYFGAPILAAVFGPEGFLAVLVGNLITSIFMLPLTIVLTGPGNKTDGADGPPDVLRIFGQSVTRALVNPIVWLPVSGMVLSLCHVTLPEPVLTSVDLIAKAAGGTSLFALGLMLYGERFVINANVLVNLGMKNFLQPALMALGAVLFGVAGPPAHQVVITGAVPTATAAAIFALKSNTYTGDATATILVSTILGVVTEGLLIAYFF
ncbi:AEC family transporter [Paraburkholderia strydomiana]|uniref:AEC family transporter n=1 Tax=Paraburkholderia strydomiana TaxID=1245417 RepID=UPI001BE573EE|nr:AEC family transporter [Paraburkholderia strydomiana]MBT2794275.1 AEC family transporter [Paraburkholderia strydomiana]